MYTHALRILTFVSILFTAVPRAEAQFTALTPTDWQSADIGNVGVSGGFTQAADGTLTVRGGGADIWGTADAFHFVYRQYTGDFVVQANLTSIQGTQAWTKVGVMVRASLAPNAAHGLMLASTGKGLAFQRRTTTGGLSTHTSGGTGTAPRWLKLVRQGTTLTAWVSDATLQWRKVGSDTIALPETVFLGVAVSSHDATRLATGTFRTVVQITPVPGNNAPFVRLLSPVDTDRFQAPATVEFTVDARDSDGYIAKVDYFADGTRIGTVTTPPYAFTWRNVSAGAYTLRVEATDDLGARGAAFGHIFVQPAPLPAEWWDSDIGNYGIPGGLSVHTGDVATLKGAGDDVWGTADAFHFRNTSMYGDGDIVARVAAIEGTQAWTKVGVMIRQDASPGSQHAFMLVSLGKGVAFQRRTVAGALSTHTSGGAGTYPKWVKLSRRGTLIVGYVSDDGLTWREVARDLFLMGTNVRIGLAVSSHDRTQLATAVFDNIKVTPIAQ